MFCKICFTTKDTIKSYNWDKNILYINKEVFLSNEIFKQISWYLNTEPQIKLVKLVDSNWFTKTFICLGSDNKFYVIYASALVTYVRANNDNEIHIVDANAIEIKRR